MERYPTRNGIAVSPFELDLPESRLGEGKKNKNYHHGHYHARTFGRLAVLQCLRDLETEIHFMPKDIHKWIHDNFGPPETATPEQAARRVIDAFDQKKMFKRRDDSLPNEKLDENGRPFRYDPIPPELVDSLVAKYSLVRVFDMAAD